ncbi:anhydro-N-acetylmuramic acid kinase [Gammaproteobacteria bacterium]
MTTTDLYVGLMSGTSLDGIDAALVTFEGDQPRLLAAHYQPYPAPLREELLTLCRAGEGEPDRLCPMDVDLGQRFATATLELLAQAKVAPEAVRAIGSHGQTIRHRPTGPTPFTLQIGDPNIIAQRTGITTVADFRRRDIAAGGEGAPLVPAFHRAVFATAPPRVVLNVGGIANITWLPGTVGGGVTGFDTGPGNTLMDAWVRRHFGQDRDEGGKWATQGKVATSLLEALLADPYFSRPPPKSTGREYFDLRWLDSALAAQPPLPPADIQATLCELTAATVARAVDDHCLLAEEVLVCGGGVHNATLMTRLAARLAPRLVLSTAAKGIDPDWVEAIAFAWLARRTLQGLSGNLPAVTGARQEVVLGGIYLKG